MVRRSIALAWMLAASCFSEETQPGAESSTDDPDATTGAMASSGAMTTQGPASTGPADSTGGASGSTADTADTTEASSTGEPECELDGDTCPAETPYCVAGSCTACASLPEGCVAIDPAAPICDRDAGVCTACIEHDECGSGACRIATGECFGEENRLWVSAAADCPASTGSEAAPFCTVGEALAVVMDQPGSEPWAVFVAGAGIPYALPADASLPDRPFALIGPASGVSAVLVGSPPWHLLVAGAGQDSYLARMTLDGGTDGGTVVECAAGDLWIDDVEIESGTTGLAVGGCEVRARRSRVTSVQGWGIEVDAAGRLTVDEGAIEANAGGVRTEGITTLRRTVVADNYLEGGISAQGGSLSLSNCALHQNVYAIGHIDLGPNVTASLNYVTALADALSCAGPTSTYQIRNSIVDAITCGGQVIVDQSLVAPGDEDLGDGNLAFPPTDYAQVFVDHPAGDLHVRVDPPAYLLGVAIRSATDPAVDLDGDARPGVGRPDYPGIDAAP